MSKASVRYGSEMRKQYSAVIAQKRQRYACPRCSKKSVKRDGTSLWQCRSCKAKFSGGAYSLQTPIGETTRGIIENIKKGITPAKARG